MTGPLAGYKVVDLSAYAAGPMATQMLAEQGADVVKIEPLGGEPFRAVGTTRHGVGAWWAATNRNKRSMALDLKDPRGRVIVQRLVSQSDVFVHQFRIGVSDRLGLGAEELTRLNPRLVYAALTGFGTRGPNARRRVYDNVVQASVGLNVVQGANHPDGPQTIRTPIADKVSALVFAQAITAALVERSTSGAGQVVETSMLHSMLWFMWPDMLMDETFLDADGVVPAQSPRDYRNLVFRTTDGYLTAVYSTADEFRALAEATGRTDWLTDPLVGDADWRIRHYSEVFDLLAIEFARRSTGDWCRELAAADAAFAPVNDPAAVLDDPQLAANSMVTELDHPTLGRQRHSTHPAHFSRTPAEVRSAPAHGEHTLELLGELGVPADEQAALLQAGVIAIPPSRHHGHDERNS